MGLEKIEEYKKRIEQQLLVDRQEKDGGRGQEWKGSSHPY